MHVHMVTSMELGIGIGTGMGVIMSYDDFPFVILVAR